jgi:hypothetical protein
MRQPKRHLIEGTKMRYTRLLSVILVLACFQPAEAQTLFHMAENQVPIAMVRVVHTPQHTEVHLQTQAAVPKVCWESGGPDSAYLLAEGRRYRFLGGDRITNCPMERNYDLRETMVLRFEPLAAQAREFSLVEGQGGENQMINPASSTRRFWNFLRVKLN